LVCIELEVTFIKRVLPDEFDDSLDEAHHLIIILIKNPKWTEVNTMVKIDT